VNSTFLSYQGIIVSPRAFRKLYLLAQWRNLITRRINFDFMELLWREKVSRPHREAFA
jgi:hypothetical protein